MNKGTTRLSIFYGALAAMILFPVIWASPAQAQNTPASVAQKIPFNRTLPTPCKEKRIRLNGEFQAQYKVNRESGGQIFIDGNFDADRITGSGLTSRGKYKAVGVGRLESSGPSPTSFTYVFNFSLNKSGTTDSLMGHVKFRINVNANGSVTTSVVAANVDCTS
jgi:hypothetical protein